MEKRYFLVGLLAALLSVALYYVIGGYAVFIACVAFCVALVWAAGADYDRVGGYIAIGYIVGLLIATGPTYYEVFSSPTAKARYEGEKAQKAIIVRSETLRAPLESRTFTGQVTSPPEKVRGQFYAFRVHDEHDGDRLVFLSLPACPGKDVPTPKKGDTVRVKSEVLRASSSWRAPVGTLPGQAVLFYDPPCDGK